jgi:ABC-2 type transport system ATP-binding protein
MIRMNGRRPTRLASAAAVTVAVLLAAATPAAARDDVVTSFDGTRIAVTLHPAVGLEGAERAPTILMTHGWGGSRDRNANGATSEGTGTVGVGPLRRAGFNVLTWDSRGFGESGGTVTINHKDFEGRDVQALLDWLARQPEAMLDGPRDPRAGMHGGSYAGGIEFTAAAIDDRIEAIAPAIAWHSLLTALYREDAVKGGWAALLFAAGQSGRLDPHITSAFGSGAATGRLSAEDRAWFEARGPGELVRRIRTPTLILQGTADTLFTPSEAIRNYEILRANDVPTKMIWFCGGHGQCLTGMGPARHFQRAVITWLRRYVAFDRGTRLGPGFEWLADDARWRSAPAFPSPGDPIIGEGSGTLLVSPADAVSGSPIAAAPAANAVNVPIPEVTAQVVGEPRLRLTYSGTGTATHVFAQIVDERRNVVLGNQVTPLPVALDGASHTVTRSLEGVAAAGGRYRLQVIGGSQVYGPVRGAGAITIASARIELPTVGATAGILPAARRCVSRRRFAIRLRGRRLRSAKVWVAGKRVPVRRRAGRLRAVVDMRGMPKRRVRVRVVARTNSGRVIRERRTYRTCAPGPSR